MAAREPTRKELEAEVKALRQRLLGLEKADDDRRRAEEELRREKELSECLINSSPIGILAFDREVHYTIWNPFMERLTQVSREEALGNYMFDLFPFLREIGEDKRVMAALEGRTVAVRDLPYKAPRTGQEGFFDSFLTPLHNTAGEIIGGLNLVHDVTERVQLEQERLRAGKLESLGILAGGLAHDFNNILTGILGYCTVAKMSVPPAHKAYRMLEAAERACERATKLTGQLLTFAKGGTPVKETASLDELIRESAGFAVRGSSARCEYDIASDLAPVEIDPSQISRVIHNIVLNADQAMPASGIIRISAHNVEVEEGDPLPLVPGGYIQISIQDEGIGMPRPILEKIFDPYYTTKAQGSGLGLATSYSIIQQHKGCITVDSEEGIGSTFHVHLPISILPLLPAVVEGEETFAGNARILVMDDDPMVRDVGFNILSELGYSSEFASDGAEAVAAYRQAKENGQPFQAVMLDLTVPGGLGGKESLQRLREVDPQVRAIVASGYSDDPVMANFRDYGFQGRLSKPYKPQELSRVLRQVLNGRDPSEGFPPP